MHINNFSVNQSSRGSNIAAGCCSPYHHSPFCYLKGESPHIGNLTLHFHCPITVQSTFFLFQMKPQLPHLWFSTPLCCVFFFFSKCRVTGLWFSHNSQCTGSALWQNRSLSLFPLLTDDHRAKFNTNNKITGIQNTHFHIHKFNLTTQSYLYITMLIYLCLGLLCDAVCHKGNRPSQLVSLRVSVRDQDWNTEEWNDNKNTSFQI